MKKKRMIALTLSVLLMLSMALTGCGKDPASSGGEGSGDTIKFTFWQPYTEDSYYYESYDQNPVLSYILANNTFNGKTVEITFVNPIAGSEKDQFNTLLSTGEYSDVISMSLSNETPTQLYEDGIVQDLTEYVKEHMPNYMAYLEANPDVADFAYSIVDGEKKILSVNGFTDAMQPNFEGFCYRRDWIVKYGTNPTTGAGFTSGYEDASDTDSYYDDVVFPSGGTDPVYISDWEWMLAIFQTAIEDLGIKDGYGMSLPTGGYYGTGDLVSAFGGGAPAWYLEDDGKTISDGTTGDNFRVYLQAMNTWYQNGWIDPAFPEHNDIFYAVDSAKVFQGKVGIWCGRRSTVGTQIDTGESEFTKDAMVFGCLQPINDLYGTDAQKNKEPNAFFQFTKIGPAVCVTDKMGEEALIAFLQLCDYLFSIEGAELTLGFTAEQAEEYNIEFYKKFNITEGAIKKEVGEDGETYYKKMISDMQLSNAAALNRWEIFLGLSKNRDEGLDRYTQEAVDRWDYYLNTGFVLTNYTRYMTAEESAAYSKINANVTSFKDKNIPGIVKGTSDSYSCWDDAGWEKFCKDYGKYQSEKVTAAYQRIMDQLR